MTVGGGDDAARAVSVAERDEGEHAREWVVLTVRDAETYEVRGDFPEAGLSWALTYRRAVDAAREPCRTLGLACSREGDRSGCCSTSLRCAIRPMSRRNLRGGRACRSCSERSTCAADARERARIPHAPVNDL